MQILIQIVMLIQVQILIQILVLIQILILILLGPKTSFSYYRFVVQKRVEHVSWHRLREDGIL